MKNSKTFLCRTCLKESPKEYRLTHTFSGHEDIDFAAMLMSCTSVCIKPNDTLPHTICENCITTLIMSYIFKQQCEKSDIFLRTHECLETLNRASSQHANDDNNIRNDEHDTYMLSTDEDHQLNQNLSNKDNLNEVYDETEIMDQNIKLNKQTVIKNSKKILVVRKHNDDEHEAKITEVNIQQNIYNRTKIQNKRKSKIYKCMECDKQFRTSYGFLYHSKIHSGIRKYVCSINDCKKRFFWEPALKRHMEVHSIEKKFLCYLCGKTYNVYDSLRHHLKSHKGERPHLCVICGKTFTQAGDLKHHMQSHNGERPYVCAKCNRSYTRPSHLKKHLNKYCGVGRNPPQRMKIRRATYLK